MSRESFKIAKSILLKPTTAPSSPANGEIYYDLGLNKFQKYENGTWSDFGGGGAAIIQGGNAFGASVVVGTTDNYSLNLLTNNSVKFQIDSSTSTITVPNSNTVSASSMTLAAGAAVSGNSNGGNIYLNAGDPAGTGTAGSIVTKGNIVPSVTATNTLGTDTNRFSTAHVGQLSASSLRLRGTSSDAYINPNPSTPSDFILVLPPDAGENFYAPVSDGAGNLSWAKATENFILNSGGININGWTTYADTAAVAPVDGTGGSPTVLWSNTTSNPLSGTKSFLFTKDAVNRQGQGASYDFTIDRASQAKVLQINFDYVLNSGTLDAGSSNLSPGDIRVWIYDVDNSALIQPSTIFLGSNSTSISSSFSSTFQTSAASLNYRLIFHIGSTSASAFSLKVDNVSVAPSKYVYGTPITDWQSYTLPITGTTTNPTKATTRTDVARWRRVGDSMEINYTYSHSSATGAANGSGTYLFGIPSGYAIDSNKVFINSAPDVGVVGAAAVYNSNVTGNRLSGFVKIYDSNRLMITTGNDQVGVQPAASSLFQFTAGTVVYSFLATVPIQGWSSSVQMSDNADTRVVGLSVRNPGGTGQAGTTSVTTVTTMTDVLVDTHAAFNTATGTYTIPVSGIYQIKATVYIENGGTAQNIIAGLYRNGSVVANLANTNFGASIAGTLTGSYIISLNAGDTITIRSNSASAAFTSFGKRTDTNLSIQKISGPSAIAASETVAASGTNQAGTSIPTSTWTTVPITTIIDNSHGALATSGIFTAPSSGRYFISGQISFAANSTGVRAIRIQKNNANTYLGTRFQPYTGVTSVITSGYLYLQAGETVTMQAYQDSGSAIALAVSVDVGVYFSIARIGL